MVNLLDSSAVARCVAYYESKTASVQTPLQRIRLSAERVRALTADARPVEPKPRFGVPKGVCTHRRKHDPQVVLAALEWIEQQPARCGAVGEAAKRFGVPRVTLSRYRSKQGRQHVAALKRDAERSQEGGKA